MNRARIPNKPKIPQTGLILPGGGARGAYQVGVIKAIADMAPEGVNPFPILVGVSVGAINATALASRAKDFKEAAEWLACLWRNLRSSKVYRTDFKTIVFNGIRWFCSLTLGGLGAANPKSLLNNAPLAGLLSREIDFIRIRHSIRKGDLRAVGISASSYTRGKAITFFEAESGVREWARARREGVRASLTVEHVLGSIALPFVFPPQRVGYDYFGDGSLRLTSPLSPAIHFGAERILVIGARDEKPDARPSKANQANFPTFGSIAGNALDILFNDNLREDIERAERVNRTVSLLSPEKRKTYPLRRIDIMVVRPSRDVRGITKKYVDSMPRTVRMLLRGVGGWGGGWQLVSYLMFEPGFLSELMELGYHDAMRQKRQLRRFLAFEPTRVDTKRA